MRLALFFILACAGCDDNLPIASFVDKIRVLALQASPAEVAPGAIVRLNPLVVEPEQANVSPLSALWLACRIDPGATTTVPCGVGLLDGSTLPPPCDTQADGTLCTLSHDLFALVTPSHTLIGSDGTGELLVTLVVTDTTAGATACYLGTLQNDGLPTEPDRCVIAYKRVSVSTASALNQNPTIDALELIGDKAQSLLSGDATTTMSPNTQHRTTSALGVTRSADSAELKPDGTYEVMSLSWFTTSGAIDGGRSSFTPAGCSSQTSCDQESPPLTATTSWSAPTSSEAATQTNHGKLHFWAVLRDDRGGVGWHTGLVEVHP